MLTQTLATIFIRDLNKLKLEIAAYSCDANLWLVDKATTNAAVRDVRLRHLEP